MQMFVVRGPNQDIAIKLIKRMKGSVESKLGITFANKETILELNGCSIEAYHLDAYRAVDNPKFILLDEADSLENKNRKTSDMFLKDTLQSQIPLLSWFQLLI